jgi:hypothetical protein
VPVASIVIVLPLALIVALAPAVNVNVSVAPLATTVLPPVTAIFLNTSLAPPLPAPELVIIILSVEVSVVNVIPDPASKFNVSALLSATIKSCPGIDMFLNTLGACSVLVIVTVSPVTIVSIPEPPTIFNVSSLALEAVEPVSPVIVL